MGKEAFDGKVPRFCLGSKQLKSHGGCRKKKSVTGNSRSRGGYCPKKVSDRVNKE